MNVTLALAALIVIGLGLLIVAVFSRPKQVVKSEDVKHPIATDLLSQEHQHLQEAARAIVDAEQLDQLFERILQIMYRGFGFQAVWAHILGERNHQMRAIFLSDQENAQLQLLSFEISRDILKLGGTLFISDLQARSESKYDDYRKLGFRTLLGLPLGVDSNIWGIVYLASQDVLVPSKSTLENLNLITELLTLGVERRRDIEALRTSEAKSRSIVNTAIDAIVTIEEDGTITTVNPAFEKMFGYMAEEVIGQNVSLLMPEPFASNHDEYLRKYLAGGERKLIGQTRELEARDQSGKIFPIDITVSELMLGYSRSYTGIIRDITDRKRRTAELRDAKELAEAATQAKSRFLANMSHEIRTPLNGILGMVTLLQDTPMTTEQREYIDSISVSGEGLLTIINDILDFSKVEAGKLDLEEIRFDPQEILEEVANMLSIRAHEKGLKLIIYLDPLAPDQIVGDPLRFRQVLLNLVNNAVKFTLEGQISVRFLIQERNAESVRFRVEVEDSGIGIPADRLDRLFHSFSQVDASTKRKFGGTGLGLAICKELIQLMGGQIGVHSIEGKGATFYFDLTRPVSLEPDTHGKSWISSTHCLLIEPSEPEGQAFVKLLMCIGAEVTWETDPKQALVWLTRRFKSHEPEPVVLVSHNFTHLALTQLIETLRSETLFRRLKVILLSDYGNRAEAAQWLEMGVSFYLLRPVRRRLLAEAIQLSLSGASMNQTPTGKITKPIFVHPKTADFRILLVEDNRINQRLAIRLLEKWGFHCDLAENGQDALDKWRHAHYDLIFMDCQMPILDGFDATRQIRLCEVPPSHVPIVAMTAEAMTGDRERCIQAGMDDYLSKPIRIPELYRVMERFFRPWTAALDQKRGK